MLIKEEYQDAAWLFWLALKNVNAIRWSFFLYLVALNLKCDFCPFIAFPFMQGVPKQVLGHPVSYMSQWSCVGL